MKFEGFLQDYKHGYTDSVMIAEIDISNFVELDEPVYTKKYNGYMFYVDGIEFLFKGNHLENDEWVIKFGIHKGNGILDVDMTKNNNTKNTVLVLKNIGKCFSLFIGKYRPQQITFIADRKSRQVTYKRLIELLYKRSEFMVYGFPEKIYSDTGKTVTYIMKRGNWWLNNTIFIMRCVKQSSNSKLKI